MTVPGAGTLLRMGFSALTSIDNDSEVERA